MAVQLYNERFNHSLISVLEEGAKNDFIKISEGKTASDCSHVLLQTFTEENRKKFFNQSFYNAAKEIFGENGERKTALQDHEVERICKLALPILEEKKLASAGFGIAV